MPVDPAPRLGPDEGPVGLPAPYDQRERRAELRGPAIMVPSRRLEGEHLLHHRRPVAERDVPPDAGRERDSLRERDAHDPGDEAARAHDARKRPVRDRELEDFGARAGDLDRGERAELHGADDTDSAEETVR